MVDESTLRRLLAGETHTMNQGVVVDSVPLYRLLGEKQPTARTKAGTVHRFDAAQIQRFAEPLSPLVRVQLHLPVRFVTDHRMDGSACVSDPVVREALVEHGLHVGEFRGARAWLSLPRAQVFAHQYPSLVQFLRQ